MAMHEAQGLSGRLTIELHTPDGHRVLERRHDNLITATGQSLVARLFTGEVSGKPELRIAVGDGAQAETLQDAALKHQLAEAPAEIPPIGAMTADNPPKARAVVKASFPALTGGQNQTLREAGILVYFPNRSPLLYNRVTFPDITRTANLEMTLTWEVFF